MPRARTLRVAAGKRLTRAGIAAFLEALAETGMVREAAARAGVPRASLYRKKATDAAFAADWAAALEAGLDQLRDEAVRRAFHGVEETVWHQGKPVGSVRRYSDALLMFLLRAHQPALYREPRGAGTGAGDTAGRAGRRGEEMRDRLAADAYELGKEHGLRELLDAIDGRTRGVRSGGELDAASLAESEGDEDSADAGEATTRRDDDGDAAELQQARQRATWPPGYAPAPEEDTDDDEGVSVAPASVTRPRDPP